MSNIDETNLPALVTPEIMTAGQFFDLQRPSSRIQDPCQRLVYAVIEDALRVWQSGGSLHSRRGPSGRALDLDEAENWLFYEPDTGRPFSLHWCCEALGWDGDVMRARLKKYGLKPIPRSSPAGCV